MTKHDSRKERGFTLIELSVVVVIIGIIISVVATVLPSLIVSSKIKKARAILEKIDYAIQGYSIANNRLPFAAAATDGIESSDLFTGYLPYHSLGLSSGQDPWGNQIRYAVHGTAGGATNLTATFADTTAFCAALTQASTAAFNSVLAHTTTATSCASADASNSTNQAFILISGGPKDMDGANSFLDGCNSASGMTFNAPNKIMDTGYDDLVEAFSINELIQRMCSGSGTGGSGSGTAAENTYTNGCTNGTDDDGDGNTDCADSDCASHAACSGSGSVTITTTTIPAAVLNSSYNATISATGGTAPYEWTLTNNGGFTGLTLNTYTGALTGTIDQCPGTYNIIVDAQDATPAAGSGPLTDSATLALQVTGNLALARTSGTGTTVTWSSTLQQETFQASGSWLGTLNWSLNSGGAAGFAISALGSDGAVLKKNGATTAGTYTFTITATDSSCSSNMADISLAVTVQASATGTPGGISGVIDTHAYTYGLFDLTAPREAYTPDLALVSGTTYSSVQRSGYDNGVIRTISISADGNIADEEVARTFFNYANGNPSANPALRVFEPDSIKVSDTITAVAFSSAQTGGQGYLRTISVNSDGTIGSGFLQSLVFESGTCSQPDIVQVSGNVYAIVYSGPDNDGWIKTVTIDSATGVMALTGYQFEFDSANATEPVIVKVSDGLFAVAYRSGSSGAMKSLSIDSSGVITQAGTLSGGFDTTCYEPALIKVNENTFAVAYRGPNDDGWIKTFSIDAAGSIALTGSSLEFDEANGYEPDIVQMGGNIFAVAYADPRGNGVRRGIISTVSIDLNGTIGSGVIDSLRFENDTCYDPSIVSVDADTAAIFFQGPNNQGKLITIGFQ